MIYFFASLLAINIVGAIWYINEIRSGNTSTNMLLSLFGAGCASGAMSIVLLEVF